MTDNDLVFIGILILIVLVSFLMGFFMMEEKVIVFNQTIVNKNPLYEDVVERFAELHTYNLTTYNCVNYSQDLGFILDNLGYETQQITLDNVNETGDTISRHRKILLILEIEPQNGEIGIKKK